MNKKKVLKKAVGGCSGKGGLSVGKSITGPVSSIIAGVSSIGDKMRKRRYDKTLSVVREARKYDNAPNFDGSGKITDAFKVRSVRDGMVGDYMERVKKGKN